MHLCPLCGKPFTQGTSHLNRRTDVSCLHQIPASSFKRHISYCRRTESRPRHRQRSCRACSAAKAKCSFTTPCSRCSTRNVDCLYDRPFATTSSSPASTISDNSVSSTELTIRSNVQPSSLPESEDYSALNIVNFQPCDQGLYGELGDIDGLISNDINGQFDILQNLYTVSGSDDLAFSKIWGSGQLSATQHMGYLARVRRSDPLLKHNSACVIETLCAIPEQMVRRTTLPPFVHPHWHLSEMPEPLAVCMRIAHLFVSRTPSMTPFIWRTIMSEQRRAVEQV